MAQIESWLLSEVRELWLPLLPDSARAPGGTVTASNIADNLVQIVGGLGWDANALGIGPTADALASALRAIEAVEGGDPLTAVNGLQTALREAQRAIRDLARDPSVAQELLLDLTSELLRAWLARRHANLRAILFALGVLSDVAVPAVRATQSDPNSPVLRAATTRLALDLGRLRAWVREPGRTFADSFLGGAVGAAESAWTITGPLIARALSATRIPTRWSLPAAAQSGTAPVLWIFSSESLAAQGAQPGAFWCGLSVQHDAASDNRPRLNIVPVGTLNVDRSGRSFRFRANVELTAPLSIGSDGVQADPGAGGNVDLSLESLNDAIPIVRLGATDGPALIIDSLALAGSIPIEAGTAPVPSLSVRLDRARFELGNSGLDSFLSSYIRSTSSTSGTTVEAHWSGNEGLRFSANGGVEYALSQSIDMGLLRLQRAVLRLLLEDQRFGAAAIFDLWLRLGPLEASVEGLGLRLDIAASPADNLPGVGVGVVGPEGVRLSLNTGPVSGGGSLIANPELGQYAGDIHLEFRGISVAAYGVLNTRMPDGSPILMPDGQTEGFSLVILISAEFTPIQLGFGFTLNGVGGLVGINRMLAADVLRAGIRDGTLQSVLFPRNPAENAPQILSTLASVFPVAVGTHVFGPMARIGWGTPPILTFDLGIVLEIGRGVRLALLGRLRMALPNENAAVVRINMDVLGIVDFDRGEVSIDASLYDSQIAGFVITGDMALRASWGAQPAFALSAGGFNPRFQPPVGFPDLRRLAINLATGDNPRLRLEAYLALTSNTVQFGSRLDVYAEAFGFNVAGMLAFDALIQLAPFGFVVDIAGAVALRRGNQVLMGVALALSLSGPRPWYARGVATFEIWIFKHSVEFELTVGEEEPLPLPTPVNVGCLLVAALSDARNWSAQLPPEGQSLVTLRAIETTGSQTGPQVLAHPLGSIRFRQRVVPLGVTLERFGSAPIEGDNRFSVASVTYGSQSQQQELESISIERDYFARSQFSNLEEDEQLSAPSFERLEAGRRVDSNQISFDQEAPAAIAPEYETRFITELGQPALNGDRQLLELSELDRLTWAGAAALSPLRAMGRGTTPEGALAVRVHDTAFTVVDLAPAPDQQMAFAGLPPMTYAAAREELLRRAAEAGRSVTSFRVSTVTTAEALR